MMNGKQHQSTITIGGGNFRFIISNSYHPGAIWEAAKLKGLDVAFFFFFFVIGAPLVYWRSFQSSAACKHTTDLHMYLLGSSSVVAAARPVESAERTDSNGTCSMQVARSQWWEVDTIWDIGNFNGTGLTIRWWGRN